MKTKKVMILPGDGIGLEVTTQAERILKYMAERFDLQINIEYAPIGGACYDQYGEPVTEEIINLCKQADAVLLGAIGGPEWDNLDYALRPEKGLLKLRAALELFANLRPAVIYGDLVHASSLKPEIVQNANLMIVRELTGGIYFGEPRGIKTEQGEKIGYNTMVYSESEIRRIAKIACEIAMLRSKKLTCVDKANVLEVSGLFRKITTEVAQQYPEINLDYFYVDNAAMQLIRDPQQFDTVVTGNLFGDILSDAAAMITGSIGMLPSASIGEKYALYEPVHGSAPDLAGQDIANPFATILSVGMMFQYTFKIPEANQLLEKAVVQTIQKYRTPDLAQDGFCTVGCQEIGDYLLMNLENL